MISVIVPVFNTEEYLNRCIDSILMQTFKDIQVILVDDGSTDNSPKICDDYARIDKRVVVIHQENTGLSGARNVGIDKADGDFLAFVDSDDYIDPNMIEKLFGIMESEDADLVAGGYSCLNEGFVNNQQKGQTKVGTYAGDCHVFLLEMGHLAVVAWNKLYRKYLFDDIRYPLGRYHEDEFVIHHILDRCTKVAYTEEILYFYMRHAGTITGMLSAKRVIDSVESLEDRIAFYSNSVHKENYNQACREWIRNVVDLCDNLLKLKFDLRKYLGTDLLCKYRYFIRRCLNEGIIKRRYYCICKIWAKSYVLGDYLFSIYDKLAVKKSDFMKK